MEAYTKFCCHIHSGYDQKNRSGAAMPNRSTVSDVATDAAMPSDNPVLNKQFMRNWRLWQKAPQSQSFQGPQIGTSAVCTFTGAWLAGDNSMPARLFRPRTPAVPCAVPQPFPGVLCRSVFHVHHAEPDLRFAVRYRYPYDERRNERQHPSGSMAGYVNPANLANQLHRRSLREAGYSCSSSWSDLQFQPGCQCYCLCSLYFQQTPTQPLPVPPKRHLTVAGLTCTASACILSGPSVLSQALPPPVPTNSFQPGI